MRIVNPALKRALRARAHALKPVVIVADRGLEPAVIEETQRALEHHELIKVRIRQDRAERASTAGTLCERTGAALIQSIGQIVTLYKPRPPAPRGSETTRPERSPSRKWSSATDRKRARAPGRGSRRRDA